MFPARSLIAACLVTLATTQVVPAAIHPNHRIVLTDLGVGAIPEAINNNGVVVGQQSNGVAFKWASGTLTPLGTLGGSQSFANDINDAGVVVGWSHDSAGKQRAYRWEQAAGMSNLDSTVSPGIIGGAAEGINSDGDIVGWRTNGTLFKSYLWDFSTPNGFLLFSDESGPLKALDINESNEVVGIGLNNGIGSFYWNGSDDPGNYSRSLTTDYRVYGGINNQGITAGESSVAAYMHVEEVSHNPIGIIAQTDISSIALGINDLGLIVGESTAKGFVYDLATHSLLNANSLPRLGFSVDTITRLTDINNSNQFAGVALVNGVEHGITGRFVARLGDYNLDNVVDNADYLKWRGELGTTTSPFDGADGNGNGVVDAADYVLWRNQVASGAMSGGSQVPEPVSGILVSALLTVATLRRTCRPCR